MAALGFSSFLLCAVLIGGMVGSDPDSVTSLKQEVLELKDSISSIPISIQAANREMLLNISNKMADNSKAFQKEFQTVLSHDSLLLDQLEDDVAQMNQNLTNQTFLIEKLSQQLEAVQSLQTCTGEPPSPRNGSPMEFERKHGSGVRYRCDRNWLAIGSSTVRCHFGKWEGRPPLCTRLSLFDAACTVRAHLDMKNHVYKASCSCRENEEKMEFSWILETGSGGALPTGANSYSEGRVAVLDLSGVQHEDRHGVYVCWYEKAGKHAGVTFVIHRNGLLARPQLASIGDTVKLHYVFFNDPSFRWLHDGQRVPFWDGRGTAKMAGVRREDAGVYEVYREGDRRGTQWFFTVIVTGCPADIVGESCHPNCTTCRNGGVCHDPLGTCVCPPGFEGQQCEVACGQNRFGPNCSESCGGGDCYRQVFCKPDPYGCSCLAGYGRDECSYKCYEGKFGADCKQTCHCASGPCDRYTGACSEGCSVGWSGPSCQIPVDI